MMKIISLVVVAFVGGISTAFASGTSTLTLADNSTGGASGAHISGHCSTYSGVRDNQDGTYPYFGNSDYSWDATASKTWSGYTVTVAVANPTYPSVAYFPSTGTVNFNYINSDPNGGGGGV